MEHLNQIRWYNSVWLHVLYSLYWGCRINIWEFLLGFGYLGHFSYFFFLISVMRTLIGLNFEPMRRMQLTRSISIAMVSFIYNCFKLKPTMSYIVAWNYVKWITFWLLDILFLAPLTVNRESKAQRHKLAQKSSLCHLKI